LRGKVREQSDITLTELQDFLLTQEQTSVHPATISRALKELGLPRKKRAS
jgi:transposase